MPRSSSGRSPVAYYLAVLVLILLSYFYFHGTFDDSSHRENEPYLDPVLLGYPGIGEDGLPEERSEIPWPGVVPVDILPKVTDARIVWDKKEPIPQTSVIRHVSGWTVFDSLYVFGDSYYIVSDSQDDFPDLNEVLSAEGQGSSVGNIRFIGTKDAMKMFGHSASHVAGVTFITEDGKEYLEDEDHFSLEVLPGLWRILSVLDQDITMSGNTYLPAPSRFIFPRLASGQWRDHRKLNALMIRSSFPSTSIETRQGWQERASIEQAYYYDIVVLGQSAASKRSPTFEQGSRALSTTLELAAPKHWWTPIRNGVLEAAGMHRGETGVIEVEGKIVITYIVTQNRILALEFDTHRKLSEGLRALERDYDWEVNIIVADKMSTYEQLVLAARSTIIVGIHGRFFSYVPFMIPNKSSTIIEFFLPGYHSSKYQVPAEAMGIEHYGVWNNTFYRSASEDQPPVLEHPKTEDERMEIDTQMVIELIEERLLEPDKKSSMPVMSYLVDETEEDKLANLRLPPGVTPEMLNQPKHAPPVGAGGDEPVLHRGVPRPV